MAIPVEKLRVAMRAAKAGILGNIFLALIKLLAGIFANSAAMISDAAHSVADIIATVVVIIGVRLSGREADRCHPYGHERQECVAAVLLAVILTATGMGIGYGGARKIMEGGGLETPGALALAAALVSIVVKEGLFWYTRGAAKKTGSGALMADAWHHRTDALSSVGSFAGILGARLGLPILDPIACLMICALILKAALTVFLDAIEKMTDKACDSETVERIHKIAAGQEHVLGIDCLRTRLFGDRIYVDVGIFADGSATLEASYSTAQRVRAAIEEEFPKVKYCMVHIIPNTSYE